MINKKKKFIGLGFKISTLVILMLAVMSSVLVITIYDIYRKECIAKYGSLAVNIAGIISSNLDGDEFLEIMKSGDETEYWKTAKTFFENTQTATGAKFIYAVTPGENNEYKYFASAFYDVPIGFAQSDMFFANEIEVAINLGINVYSKVYDAGEDVNASYGHLISGFAPIFDSAKNVVGAVGVDISVDKALADSDSFGLRISLIFVIFTLIVARFIYLYTKKTLGVPIAAISNASIELADGFIKTPYFQERNDEIGVLAKNFQKMQTTIESLNFDIESLVREAAKGQLNARAEENKYSGEWNVLMAELNRLLDSYDSAREMIIDSINYASKIQKNLLPNRVEFEKAFSDYSIIWKPRDIVGGDMYWLKNFKDGAVLCVCDCTGHGTPGALLTMLVASAFDTMINEENYKDTAQIIYRLDEQISTVLNAKAPDKEYDDGIKDGCDLAVVFIAKDGSVTLSSANTHVFICDGKEVTQIKGQRLYVGEGKIKSKENVKVVSIPFNPDNKFYIASDGLYDQVSSETDLPFGYKAFKKLILDNHNERQFVISEIIWSAFEEYRGKAARLDDFEFITFKI